VPVMRLGVAGAGEVRRAAMKRTLYEIGKGIRVDTGDTENPSKVVPSGRTVVYGLTPTDPPKRVGYHVLTPEELAGLAISQLEVDRGKGKEGYQRGVNTAHARAIARRLKEGYPMPPILYALPENGEASEVVDGQHRALGALIARMPIHAVAFDLSQEDRARLFAGQRAAKAVDRRTLILNGSGLADEYIQDALTAVEHPWSELIAEYNGQKDRIPVATAWDLISRYVLGTYSNVNALTPEFIGAAWDAKYADELADLIIPFGSKETNPAAFDVRALRAITYAAIAIIRRRESAASDKRRWVRHMPAFRFQDYPHVRSSAELADHLVAHWNKRMAVDKRVSRR
jgi:hypothetical protein